MKTNKLNSINLTELKGTSVIVNSLLQEDFNDYNFKIVGVDYENEKCYVIQSINNSIYASDFTDEYKKVLFSEKMKIMTFKEVEKFFCINIIKNIKVK